MTNFERIKQMGADEIEQMVTLIVNDGCVNHEAKNCEGCIFDKLGICEILTGDDVKEWLTSEADEG